MLRIRNRNGMVLQGILLALEDQKVRVAVNGSDDVVEYRLVSQHWISEDCEVVTLEFGDEGLPLGSTFADTMVPAGLDRLQDGRCREGVDAAARVVQKAVVRL